MKKYISLYENSLNNVEDIIKWFNFLQIPNRKPVNINKTEHNIILKLKNLIDERNNSNKDFIDKSIENVYSYLRLSDKELEQIYSKKDDKPNITKTNYATYKKNDIGSYDRFLNNIKIIDDFLKTLKGYHKKAIKNLVINFISSKEMKVPAKYSREKDMILINPLSKKVGKTSEEYGSLKYIILHELGHRYLRYNPQSWNISDTSLYTTDYSKKNLQTWNEEEVFAELFALSNWKNKYSQYINQIKDFEKRLQ